MNNFFFFLDINILHMDAFVDSTIGKFKLVGALVLIQVCNNANLIH